MAEEKMYVLRNADKNRQSHGGFQWPESGPVECHDWDPEPVCSGGLHGLTDGIGNYSLLCDDSDAVWQIVEVNRPDLVDLGGKCKFPRGRVVYSGSMAGALTRISNEWAKIAGDMVVNSGARCDEMEYSAVADVISRHLSAKLGITSPPWPKKQERRESQQ